MRRFAGTVSVVILLALAYAGRQIAASESDSPSRAAGLPSASLQLLGSLRTVPQIALWQRVREAELQGDWGTLTSLFDLISGLTPTNAAVTVWQARTEALLAGPDQPDAESEWLWIEQGLKRLSDGRAAAGNVAIIDEGFWTIGFYAGRRHPARIASELWKQLGETERAEAAKRLAAVIAGSAEAKAFLRDHGTAPKWIDSQDGVGTVVRFHESESFQRLGELERATLVAADLERWAAMKVMAERGIRANQGARSRLMFEYLRTVQNLMPWADSEARGVLIEEATDLLRAETRRLEGFGLADEMEFFRQLLAELEQAARAGGDPQ